MWIPCKCTCPCTIRVVFVQCRVSMYIECSRIFGTASERPGRERDVLDMWLRRPGAALRNWRPDLLFSLSCSQHFSMESQYERLPTSEGDQGHPYPPRQEPGAPAHSSSKLRIWLLSAVGLVLAGAVYYSWLRSPLRLEPGQSLI